MIARNYEDPLEEVLIEITEGLSIKNWIFQLEGGDSHGKTTLPRKNILVNIIN